ncbi:hypothetical protein FRC14_004510 [Serendipita sp. 396]|nr:hypothetical protein FRC14_004510 [Serendipita sp. 396]KAG8788065.1 hypothetical protein FRC15_006384 [Serendipita sp. 397]KAG8803048.1 hypothetical protein FRC16_007558 [Serendipita sp. 398]KAG8826622.1 hypothetical protein FRC19_008451 [Serendipita sp. 401]KAG8859202.1 hypothetical protein FRB91_008697 [Serendipita sp. 411]KAG8874146.1 hypothetical protein FRC20_006657 [Serendipita sp. 405]
MNAYDWVLEHKPLAAALILFSVASLSLKTLSFLKFFTETFLIGGKRISKFGAKRGAYALVTGATDGIGREFALQLAKAGFGVVLVSRSKAKLDELAAEIEKQFQVPTMVQVVDFSKPDLHVECQQLTHQLEGIDVGVLVNNVGRSHEMPVYFAETPEQEMKDIINININGTLAITRVVLPKMLQKKNGLILNMGSFAGAAPSPMLATYSGSKAFLAYWSRALAEEYKNKGIVVQLVNTYFVVSKMSKIRRPSLTTPTPKAFVKSVLGHIGQSCGAIADPYTLTPYWSHSVADYFLAMLNMPYLLISYTHKLHVDIRRRALKKREREAKSQ